MRDLSQEVERLSPLVAQLRSCACIEERIALLQKESFVQEKLSSFPLEGMQGIHRYLFLSLLAIDQEHLFETGKETHILDELAAVEQFYATLGGVVGYHWLVLTQLLQKEGSGEEKRYHPPPSIDITQEEGDVLHYLQEGIASLPRFAEIYPVGGAADRLRLLDPATQEPLPAALLPFCGFTLLEGLIRDLQAREYLYFKLFHAQILTPIAMMTSFEKHNHEHVQNLCVERRWFGRPSSSFRFFCQPPVPTLDLGGKWCTVELGKLLMKPGGHGVLWKLAQDTGVLQWIEERGREKLLIRQINNPLAGIDYGLLAFCGVGCVENKQFGFASCARQVASAEGVNLLIEKEAPERWCLTNIEYCDFAKHAIPDLPREEGSCYSQFPSNTNILFADIEAVVRTLPSCPLPGMLVNCKSVQMRNSLGEIEEKSIVRLESTMQNLADHLEGSYETLPTFLTHHVRHKTISAIKKMRQVGGPLLETPEGSFYDLLVNAHDLLQKHCQMDVPPLPSPESYDPARPPFLFFYHPALGPLFSIIGQKMRKGVIAEGSELLLEMAEVEIEELRLNGSLHVRASQVMGVLEEECLVYSDAVGSCVLHRVTIENAGIDRESSLSLWKQEIVYKELCEITIEGNGEFYARDVCLKGNLKVTVKNGTRLTLFEQEGVLQWKEEPLLNKERWHYHISDSGRVVCSRLPQGEIYAEAASSFMKC